MAETTSARFGVLVWGAGTDSPSRVEFNGNFNALETLGAIDKQGTFSARPAAGIRGTYYWDTDNSYLWRDNGTGWDLTTSKTRDMTVKSSAVGVVPMLINAIASQTAALIDAQVNSVSKFSVSASGSPTANIYNGKSASFINDVTTNPVIYGKGVASQSAALLSLQDSAGTNQFSVSPTGLLTSPGLATTGTGTSTGAVVNAASATNVAGFTNWSGTPSFEVRLNRPTAFNDFMYLKHDVADNTAATRRLGLVMKAGAEDGTGAGRSAAIYLQSTVALFDTPSLKIDVRDQNLWTIDPTSGSVTSKPVTSSGGYFSSAPGTGTGAFNADNTWMGTQGSGNSLYFRSGNTSTGYNWYAGGSHTATLGDPGSGGQTLASLSTYGGSSGKFIVGKINITDLEDVSPTTVNPGLMIGSASGLNLIFDEDEILARNNGSAATTLQIQHDSAASLRLGVLATKVYINDVRLTITNGGTTPPGTAVAGDVWIDARSPSGGLKSFLGGSWVNI